MRGLALMLFACVAGACAAEVQRLDIHDERLPVDARRWLADAEDEVVIAAAMVDELEADLEQLRRYRIGVTTKLEDSWVGSDVPEGEDAWAAFAKYSEQRIALKELEIEKARLVYDLAILRLTQARAETAVRYDLAVYDLVPIGREVEALKREVVVLAERLERRRAAVETAADDLWLSYAAFTAKGGVSNHLWLVQ